MEKEGKRQRLIGFWSDRVLFLGAQVQAERKIQNLKES